MQHSIGAQQRVLLQAALPYFQTLREPPVHKICHAAHASLACYERMDSLIELPPIDFAYSYMTRTGCVSHNQMRRIDPQLTAAYEKAHPEVLHESGD